jgi:hypothetical protein
MRYVPDPFKNEFVNIGVVLLGRDQDFADVRFTRDWARVRCLDPQADVDILEALEKDIRDQLHASNESRRAIVYRLQDTLSNSLQITEPKALLSSSPQTSLEELARTYLERPPHKRSSKLGARQKLVSRMQDAFESAGVWNSLNKRIKASTYTYPGDPLKIDCGYRPNGVIKLFQAVSLTTDPDIAKVLAFSYPALSAGIARVENAKADLTAIVEDGLDRNDESIQFALNTLEGSSIQIAVVGEMAAIAERARVELKL